jgi:tetratricopeptide (TPR) repeat protein
MEVEDSLVRELIGQVRIGGGVGFGGMGRIASEAVVRVETPFLQMVLQKLWDAERKTKSKVMREKTLHDLGDAKKIVLDHVDSVMQAAGTSERAAASSLFDRLVTPSRSKIAYSLVDLVDLAGDEGPAVEPLVKRLSNAHVRILREVAAGEGQAVKYEIFHDVLSDAVLAWRAKHLRDVREAEKKKGRIGCAVVAVVVLAIIFGIAWYLHRKDEERQRLENKALEAQAKLLQVMTERANSMGSAGTALGDLTLLRTALDGYKELGDVAGQQRILGQIAALLANDPSEDKYKQALAKYDEALSLGGDERILRDLRAKRALVVGDHDARQGDQKAAVAAYLSGAEFLKQNNDAGQQAQALTSAAVASQNLNDLDGAEKLWREALAIQQSRKDYDGQSKSLAGINSIARQRKLAAIARPVEIVVPFTEACTVESMSGFWLEVPKKRAQRAPSFIWRFDVSQDKFSVKALEVRRVDGTAKGFFVSNPDEPKFNGSLEWLDGQAVKDVQIDFPSEQQNCGRLNTNQSFYFVRTKYNPPAAAY